MAEVSMLSVGLAGFFLAVGVLAYAAVDFTLERRRAQARLRALPEMEFTPAEARERHLARPVTDRVIVPGLQRVGELARRYTPAEMLDRLDNLLAQMGSPAGWDGERVLAAKVVTATVGLVGALLFVPLLDFGAGQLIVAAPLMTYVGFMVPEWILRSRAAERQKEVQRALPDALDLLSISVKAGLGFDAAVDRVASEIGGPLGDELRRMLREMQLGRSRHEALRQLADRNPISDIESFVLAMIQADIFGIAISRVLEVQSDEMRLRRRQRAEERAQKVPVKIIFPVMFCIFPALFIVLLGPAGIQVYRALSGAV